jgi:hypothetical protein
LAGVQPVAVEVEQAELIEVSSPMTEKMRKGEKGLRNASKVVEENLVRERKENIRRFCFPVISV